MYVFCTPVSFTVFEENWTLHPSKRLAIGFCHKHIDLVVLLIIDFLFHRASLPIVIIYP